MSKSKSASNGDKTFLCLHRTLGKSLCAWKEVQYSKGIWNIIKEPVSGGSVQFSTNHPWDKIGRTSPK